MTFKEIVCFVIFYILSFIILSKIFSFIGLLSDGTILILFFIPFILYTIFSRHYRKIVTKILKMAMNNNGVATTDEITYAVEWTKAWAPKGCSHCMACKYYQGIRKASKDREYILYNYHDSGKKLCGNKSISFRPSCSTNITCGSFERWIEIT